MALNDAPRFYVLAAFALLASACVSGPPMPIPVDEVLAPPAPPAPHDEVALGEEFHAAGVGADHLRGLSAN